MSCDPQITSGWTLEQSIVARISRCIHRSVVIDIKLCPRIAESVTWHHVSGRCMILCMTPVHFVEWNHENTVNGINATYLFHLLCCCLDRVSTVLYQIKICLSSKVPEDGVILENFEVGIWWCQFCPGRGPYSSVNFAFTGTMWFFFHIGVFFFRSFFHLLHTWKSSRGGSPQFLNALSSSKVKNTQNVKKATALSWGEKKNCTLTHQP